MTEEKKVGFVAMTSEKKAVESIPEIGVGMIGHAFMGKAHSNGWKQMPYIFWPPAAIPKLIKICGIPESDVAEASRRFGYEGYTTDWKEIINDDKIQIVDNEPLIIFMQNRQLKQQRPESMLFLKNLLPEMLLKQKQ